MAASRTFLPFASGASSLVSLARHLEETADSGHSPQSHFHIEVS
ncbi:MAG: hypothetical protein ACNA7O_14230 [Rhodobacterales bacterium]